MTLREMKKTLLAHWKLFVKEDSDKKEDVFYGGKDGKKPFNPKKRFKGDCRKCGKQGHKAADCRGNANAGEGKGKGGGKDNSNVTCYKCQEKGHYARECPNKKKEEFGLFCGAICQEMIDGEYDLDNEEVEENASEWTFVGIAEAISNSERSDSDDETTSTASDDDMPNLVAKHKKNDSSVDSLDSFDDMPGLTQRCDENSVDSDDDVPELTQRCDDSSVDSDDDIEETVNMSETVNPDTTKWLLDTGASIHADTTGHGVENEKPSSVTVNIANGNIVTPRGVGEKTILDYETGYPLKIRKMHVIPEFAK